MTFVDENLVPERIRELILSESDINIFDIFAVLYSYCDPIFSTIWPYLTRGNTPKLVMRDAMRIESTVLPSLQHALNPLNKAIRQRLITELGNFSDQPCYALKCYTILRAIDIAYGNMSARNIGLSNFPSISQHLNINTPLGYVYHKQPSPLYQVIQSRFGKQSSSGRPAGEMRTGREQGRYLRDYIYNLVYLRVPDGYHVDFGTLDTSVRLCFPENLGDCKVALVPLIDQIEQVDIEIFDADLEGKIPFRFTGLLQQDKVVSETISILRQLNDNEVTIVIFPELCVPEIVRKEISQGLARKILPNIKMVVAGSFHNKLDMDWVNISYVLGPDGETLWCQQKLQPYTLMPYEAESIPALSKLANNRSYENISTPSPRIVVVRDTPLGRMVVLICSDLLSTDPHRQILVDLGVNFIAVPSMTANLESAFESATRHFAIYSQASTVVSNACAMARERRRNNNEVTISFVYLPGYPQTRRFTCNMPAGKCTFRQCSSDYILQIGTWPLGFSH